jgi:CDP-diacylglycerol---glycerol-3-phosphate 3-phosphatidyltransferase
MSWRHCRIVRNIGTKVYNVFDNHLPTMKRNLPNIFTISRAILAPIFMVLLLSGGRTMTLIAGLVFIVAAITDYVDGWLARRFNVSSAWGTLVDPLADKVLTTAAFVAFAVMNLVEWWMVAAVITRDVATTLFRSYADAIGKPLITSRGAKAKTFAQMTFIIVVLVLLGIRVQPLPAWLSWLDTLGQYVLLPIVLYVAMLLVTAVTVWTGVEYFLANRTIARRWCVKFLRSTVRRRAKI